MKRDQLKSLLLGAILLAGITLPAKAQIGEQRHNFAIGINGGANYSTCLLYTSPSPRDA